MSDLTHELQYNIATIKVFILQLGSYASAMLKLQMTVIGLHNRECATATDAEIVTQFVI